jgi:hypothetical protein
VEIDFLKRRGTPALRAIVNNSISSPWDSYVETIRWEQTAVASALADKLIIDRLAAASAIWHGRAE